MRIKLDMPNDCDRKHIDAAIEQMYNGDVEACENDLGSRIYELLAEIAKKHGLEFVEPTDFGAVWEGSWGDVKRTLQSLPSWAFWEEEEKR